MNKTLLTVICSFIFMTIFAISMIVIGGLCLDHNDNTSMTVCDTVKYSDITLIVMGVSLIVFQIVFAFVLKIYYQSYKDDRQFRCLIAVSYIVLLIIVLIGIGIIGFMILHSAKYYKLYMHQLNV